MKKFLVFLFLSLISLGLFFWITEFSSLGIGAASGITFSFLLRGAEILIALLGLIFLIKLSIKFFLENKLKKVAP